MCFSKVAIVVSVGIDSGEMANADVRIRGWVVGGPAADVLYAVLAGSISVQA